MQKKKKPHHTRVARVIRLVLKKPLNGPRTGRWPSLTLSHRFPPTLLSFHTKKLQQQITDYRDTNTKPQETLKQIHDHIQVVQRLLIESKS